MQHIGNLPGATHTPAVVVGDLVFTAGQVGEDHATHEIPADFEAEVGRALDNLDAVLTEAGSGLSRIAQATCYIADLELVDSFNAVYRARIPEPRPPRATVQVAMIAPYRIEIVVVATREGTA